MNTATAANTATPASPERHSGPTIRTLLRHEVARTRGPLGVVVLGTSLFAVVGALIATTPIYVLANLGLILGFGAAGALPPIALIVLAIDYWLSAYGRTGYLTQSLPLRGSRIYAARLLYGSLVGVAATVWALALALLPALAAAREAADPGQGAVAFLVKNVREVIAPVGALWWLFFAALGVALIVSYLAQYYFAASIGSEGRLGAMGPAGPVLVWFCVYLLMQVLAGVGLFAVPVGVGMSGGSLGFVPMDLWGALVANQPPPQGFPLGFLVPMLLVSALLAWRTAYSWDRKVSLR
ncbi:hypothetical protein BJY21_003650 [Kineosphaera limosa]|uniref:Uncharacterized protein n=1 Tax=Kineosphaera limosa NBRC 100340 TaxID=1184609 RepID=K6XB09_9MICO|nr:hypothetical protein [Kineosphaera limosa]NYE02466.1 hypothetical protein [Kineosphaera limosa]GAB96009.1 hypothetical protein KILIM_030_00520 [Kineosphaera limosa NBRC 100340]